MDDDGKLAKLKELIGGVPLIQWFHGNVAALEIYTISFSPEGSKRRGFPVTEPLPAHQLPLLDGLDTRTIAGGAR